MKRGAQHPRFPNIILAFPPQPSRNDDFIFEYNYPLIAGHDDENVPSHRRELAAKGVAESTRQRGRRKCSGTNGAYRCYMAYLYLYFFGFLQAQEPVPAEAAPQATNATERYRLVSSISPHLRDSDRFPSAGSNG